MSLAILFFVNLTEKMFTLFLERTKILLLCEAPSLLLSSEETKHKYIQGAKPLSYSQKQG